MSPTPHQSNIKAGLWIAGIGMILVICAPYIIPTIEFLTGILLQIAMFILLCIFIGACIVGIGTMYNKQTEGKMPGYYTLQTEQGKTAWNTAVDWVISILAKTQSKPATPEPKRPNPIPKPEGTLTCPNCHGHGHVEGSTCFECTGSGFIKNESNQG